MIKKVCDIVECKLHPEYKEVKDDIVINEPIESHTHFTTDMIGSMSISSNNIAVYDGGAWSSISTPTQTVRFQTPYIDCPIECMFCAHRQPADMYKEIIATDAKNLLEE